MKKQFDTPSTMKVKDRKYFKGTKKLKNIKMYEEFSTEETSDSVTEENTPAEPANNDAEPKTEE